MSKRYAQLLGRWIVHVMRDNQFAVCGAGLRGTWRDTSRTAFQTFGCLRCNAFAVKAKVEYKHWSDDPKNQGIA